MAAYPRSQPHGRHQGDGQFWTDWRIPLLPSGRIAHRSSAIARRLTTNTTVMNRLAKMEIPGIEPSSRGMRCATCSDIETVSPNWLMLPALSAGSSHRCARGDGYVPMPDGLQGPDGAHRALRTW